MRHKVVWIIVGSLFLAGCSTARPILYPNAHFQSVGKETAEQDIESCKQLAKSAGAEESGGKAGRVATNTAVGGGVGAAAGAVGGAISGSPGTGAMIGAATGAVWGSSSWGCLGSRDRLNRIRPTRTSSIDVCKRKDMRSQDGNKKFAGRLGRSSCSPTAHDETVLGRCAQ